MDNDKFKQALEEILKLKTNPIRRNKYAGNGGYLARDRIQTKDRIFEIARKALD